MDIPAAGQHRDPDKAGYLTKLSGRSFPYIPQWKRRYCVLAKGKLYYYEREDSKAGEKSNGVINLEYFDQVAEAAAKECKKATNVFIITSQDRSFFDPGRHLFSADTLPDMKDWIRKLQSALDQIRNNNRPVTSTSTSAREGGKRRKEENAENKENAQQTSNKEKKKKKEDTQRSSRKSTRAGVSSESQTDGAMPERDSDPPLTPPHKGVQLPGMSALKGIQLPGMVPKEDSPPPAATEEAKDFGNTEDGMPTAGPTLTCVTKQRVKGPQGRRAPQSRRTMAAGSLKNRASSLSALEYQELNDNSEAPWLNRSLDLLEDGDGGGTAMQANGAAQPASAAYTYSSEEDPDDDGEHSQADSLPTSASAMPPPPPPRSASYGMELRRPPYLAQLGHQGAHTSLGEMGGSVGELGDPKRRQGAGRGYGGPGEWQGSGDNWEGSRGSLAHARDPGTSASPVMDDLDNMLMNESVHQTSGIMDSASDAGSDGSTCRASDRQHHQHHEHQASHQHQSGQHHHQARKKTPDLSRFTTAVRHLQRHVVEIDRAVFGITGDVTGTRQEVTSLKDAVLALQADTDTITSTLAHLTEEAIAAQQKISLAKQEAESVQRTVKAALAEAEKAKSDQQRSRKEYDDLLLEMRTVIREMKETKDVATGSLPGRSLHGSSSGKHHHSTSKDSHGGSTRDGHGNKDQNSVKIQHSSSLGKLPETSLKFSSVFNREEKHRGSSKERQAEGKERTIWSKPYQPMVKEHRYESKQAETRNLTTSQSTSSAETHSSSTKASTGSPSSKGSGGTAGSVSATTTSTTHTSSQGTTTSPKSTGYQSLFARPSSLLSSLTNRASLTKSVSFADQKDTENAEADKSHSSTERKKKEDKHHSEKKHKEDKHHKDDKRHAGDTSSKERKSKDKKEHSSIDRKERREKKERHESRDKKTSLKDQSDSGHIISNLSLEDIPMADEHSHELLDIKASAAPRTCSSSFSLATSANYSLGKSSSTPVVAYSSGNRPRALPLNREHHRGDYSQDVTESPESPLAPSPFPRSASALPPLDESNSFSETSSLTSFHRPGSTPGPMARYGSMTTVPEDRAVVGPPPTKKPGKFAISRQNSSPNIPLQRQNSAPTFPLQRQHSLGVVPENGRLPRQESLMSVPEERPITDQTLPLSPAPSMTYFPISPCASLSTVAEPPRPLSRTSMELVTGPVLAGSAMQEASATGTLPVLIPLEEEEEPTACSTLKKDFKSHKDVLGILI